MENNSFDALSKRRLIEVQQKSELESRQPKVGQHLGHMDGSESLDALDLDEDLFMDNEVRSMLRHNLAFVQDRNVYLSPMWDTAGAKLDTHGLFVSEF